MIIKTCPKCNADIEYRSEVHLIPCTDPQEAGIGGECSCCNTEVYSKFKLYEAEITYNDEDYNVISTKRISY